MNIVLLGPAGSGKGYISNYLINNLKFSHISTGELCRKEIAKDTDLGKYIASLINVGILVPDEQITAMLKSEIDKRDNQNLIFDGYPRTLNQARMLDDICKIDLVFLIDVPKELVIKRLLARRYCEKCSSGYSLLNYDNDKCEKCGGNLISRDDDNEQSIIRRLDKFDNEIGALKDYYKYKLYILNNSENNESVFKNIDNILKNYI